MISPGHFKLHDRAEPPLGAGDYVLTGDQSATGGVFEEHRAHVRITSPRYQLPPDQILSTWPAANEEGAFESRLPQIVIRRRTLPWERVVDADRSVPWLALVLIAEGEGDLSDPRPIAECVTPPLVLDGPNDVVSGVYLTVTESVVRKVFPTKEDLALLTHVREVDIDDTELAMGDDDGFLAVVLANRLPQFDRATCSPVRYQACLINLEGQIPELPRPEEPVFEFVATAHVADYRLAQVEYSADPDHRIMGTGQIIDEARVLGATVTPGDGIDRPTDGVALDSASGAARVAPTVEQITGAAGQTFRTSTVEAAGVGASGAAIDESSWQTTPRFIEEVAVSASEGEVGRLVRDAMGRGFRLSLDHLTAERTLRFPVLAHWSFTCTGAGSFESLMKGLDVGLLGTVPAEPSERPRPDCAAEPGGDAPPGAPGARPAPELAETGLLGLAHQTRGGDHVRAWYRGPLTPHPTTRRQIDADGRLPLAHVSDQLRRVTPDGREDLTLAAAFEIGRLLALSQPSIVAALARWRREQFGAARAQRLGALAFDNVWADVKQVRPEVIGQLVAKEYILEVAGNPLLKLAPNRVLVDAGRPLTQVARDVVDVVATGFQLDADVVREALAVGGRSALNQVAVPVARTGRFDAGAAATLQTRLGAEVDAKFAGTVRRERGGPTNPQDEPAADRPDELDALDELIDGAVRRRAEEVDR